MPREELKLPARDGLVTAAIRQMARDISAYEAARKVDTAEVIDRTTTYLRNRLGRCPTPAEVARAGGVDVEDILDEVVRRRRNGRFPRD